MANSAPTLDRSHIRPGDRICAAVSGGADSVALLLLLHAANALPRNALGVGLSAVHVHHGLRGDGSGRRPRLCRGALPPARKFHCTSSAATSPSVLPAPARQASLRPLRRPRALYVTRLRRPHRRGHRRLCAHRAHPGRPGRDCSDEIAARSLDRGAERNLPGRRWSPKSAATHHAGNILRPLLGVHRADLIAYLELRNQGWRTDSTNADQAFTRNRVRHSVLPLLREFNPAIELALANLAELAREDEARWQSELSRILPQLLLPGRPVRGGGRGVSATSRRIQLRRP